MSAPRLPAATRMGEVEIAVRDLDRALRFYRDTLGLRVRASSARGAELGDDDETLLRLVAAPEAPARAPGQAGLFHVAYLVPSRADLGCAIRHLIDARYPLQGASDHTVSEALYLADPEGNGIEIYADRPRAAWPPFDQLGWSMGPRPMDVHDVLAAGEGRAWEGIPRGTRVGHVHLNVNELAPAAAFYRDALGFDPVAEMMGSAAFLSAGGYHHHVAVNTWGTAGGPKNTGETLGLRSFSVVVPDREAREGAIARLGGGALVDPSGNVVRVSG